MYDARAMLRKVSDDFGVYDEVTLEAWQKGKQEGWLKGRQEGSRNIIEFLREGHTIEEAEEKFALT